MNNNERVTLRLDFVTDETKAFARTIEATKQFNRKINQARKEIAELEKQIAKSGENATNVAKLEAAHARLAEKMRNAVTAGQSLSKMDLSKVAPETLRNRLGQINSLLAQIPLDIRKSNAEAKALVREQERVAAALNASRMNANGLSDGFSRFRAEIGPSIERLMRIVAILAVAKQGFDLLFSSSKAASELEQTRVALEGILNSKRLADKVFADIIKLANESPFETAELADHVKMLAGMGIEYKKLVPTMSALGDIAAVLGKDKLPRLVLAYGQVSAKARLQGQELLQFTEAGVPLVAVLLEHFKKLTGNVNLTERAIFDMVEKGKVGFKDVEIALQTLTSEGGKFYNQMARQSQTLPGLLSTLRDNLRLAWAAFGTGLNESLKEIARSFIVAAKSLNPSDWERWGRAVGRGIKFLYDFLPILIRGVAAYYTFKVAVDAVTAAQNLFNTTLKASPWGFVLGVAAALLPPLIQKMTTLTNVQKELNDLNKTASDNAKENIKRSNELFGVLKDETAGRELHREAFLRLKELYPEQLKNYSTEKDLLADIENAHRRVNEAILERAFVQAQAKRTSELATELIDLEVQKSNKRQSFETNQRQALDLDANQNNSFSNESFSFNSYSYGAAEDAQALSAIDAEIQKRNEALSAIGKATSAAYLSTAEALKGVDVGFNRFDARIKSLNELLKKDPANLTYKKQLEEVLKEKKAFEKEIVASETKTAKKKDELSRNEKMRINKSIKDRLLQLEAETQAAVNAATLKHLRLGEMEEAFEADILEVKIEGLKKERAYAEQHRKLLIGDAEQIEAEIIKTERKLRDVRFARRLEALDKAANTEQSKVELQLARHEVAEAVGKDKQLQITKKLFADKLKVYENEGKTDTEEYTKLLIAQANIENEIANRRLDAEMERVKKAAADQKQLYQQQFEDGQIDERQRDQQGLYADLQAVETRMETMVRLKETETAEFRRLELEQASLKRKIAVNANEMLIGDVRGASAEQLEIWRQQLDEGVLTQANFNLKLAENDAAALKEKLKRLEDAKQKETEIYKDTEKALSEALNREAKARGKVAEDEARTREKAIRDVGGAVLDFFKQSLQNEIQALSGSEEARKKNAERIKKLQKQQVEIDNIKEVAGIWSTVFREYGLTMGLVMGSLLTGVAFMRRQEALDAIDAQKFAKGGYTGGGTHRDETGHKVAGIVHDGEYVIPKWLMPRVMPIVQGLEQMRVRGYATGGWVQTSTHVLQPSVSVFAAQNASNTGGGNMEKLLEQNNQLLSQLITATEQGREVRFDRNHLANLYKSDAADRASAAIRGDR